MAAKIFEFKPKLVSPMNSLYVLVQEAANWASALQLRAWALSQQEAIEAATCVTLSEEQQKARAQQIAGVKYEAQLAELKARGVGETLPYRGMEFTSEKSYLLRQLHAVESECCAIDVQLICVRLIADAVERDGQVRPVGEFDFITAKAARKQAEAEALQAKIASLTAAGATALAAASVPKN